MTAVKDSFNDWSQNEVWDREIVEWFRGHLKNAKCLVCGELVLDRKQFLWWRADTDIILCCDCAEHTLGGLSRDLAELKGDIAAKGKTGEKYSAILLKKEVEELRHKIENYSNRIVLLQNMLGRAN